MCQTLGAPRVKTCDNTLKCTRPACQPLFLLLQAAPGCHWTTPTKPPANRTRTSRNVGRASHRSVWTPPPLAVVQSMIWDSFWHCQGSKFRKLDVQIGTVGFDLIIVLDCSGSTNQASIIIILVYGRGSQPVGRGGIAGGPWEAFQYIYIIYFSV